MRSKFKFMVLILTSVLMLSSFVGCDTVSRSPADDAKPGKLKNIVFGGISQGDYLTASQGIAQQLGFFEEELEKAGYSITFSGFQSGPAVNEAFESGDIDVANMGDIPSIIARANDPKCVAVSAQLNANYAILARNDFNFNSYKDFEGMNVGSVSGTVYQYIVETVLDKGGADISKVNIVNAASAQMIASGDVDIIPGTMYMCAEYEKQGIGKIIASFSDTPELSGVGITYASRKFVEENPDAIKAINNAYKRVYEFAKSKPEKYFQMLSDSTSNTFSSESFAKEYTDDSTFEGLLPYFDETKIHMLENMKQFALDKSIISSDFDLDDWLYIVE
ncbi:MAG: ABC transporter substrate-binding protein [Eubacterium sp.]|nr:ABC transporter substrate-binding protein [Eubacterium sp.]